MVSTKQNLVKGLQIFDRDQGHFEAVVNFLHSQKEIESHRVYNRFLESLNVLGRIRYNIEFCIKMRECQLMTAQIIGNRLSIANAHGALGEAYCSSITFVEEAEYHLNMALNIFKELGNERGQIDPIGILGLIATFTGRLEIGLDLFRRQMKLAQKYNSIEGVISAEHYVGLALMEMGKYRQAIEKIESAIHFAKKAGQRAKEGDAFNSLSTVYLRMNEPRKALAALKSAIPIHRELGDKFMEAGSCFQCGTILGHLNKRNQAISYAEESLRMGEIIGLLPLVLKARDLLSDLRSGKLVAPPEPSLFFK